MSRTKKRQFVRHPESIACRRARAREVRDLYSKLRKKYRPQIVDQFFRENYIIQPSTVEMIIRESDGEPVLMATASIIYRTAIQDTFHL